jgi:hypothetical protein
MLLEEAKIRLQSEVHLGTTCLCCGQHAQIYQRTLTSSMCKALIIWYQTTDVDADGWFHGEKVLKASPAGAEVRGDAPKLRFWDLVEAKADSKQDGNPCSGFYRVTEKGEQFIQSLISIPATASIYNNACIGFSEKHVNIKEALKNKFNYDKLLRGEHA